MARGRHIGLWAAAFGSVALLAAGPAAAQSVQCPAGVNDPNDDIPDATCSCDGNVLVIEDSFGTTRDDQGTVCQAGDASSGSDTTDSGSSDSGSSGETGTSSSSGATSSSSGIVSRAQAQQENLGRGVGRFVNDDTPEQAAKRAFSWLESGDGDTAQERLLTLVARQTEIEGDLSQARAALENARADAARVRAREIDRLQAEQSRAEEAVVEAGVEGVAERREAIAADLRQRFEENPQEGEQFREDYPGMSLEEAIQSRTETLAMLHVMSGQGVNQDRLQEIKLRYNEQVSALDARLESQLAPFENRVQQHEARLNRVNAQLARLRAAGANQTAGSGPDGLQVFGRGMSLWVRGSGLAYRDDRGTTDSTGRSFGLRGGLQTLVGERLALGIALGYRRQTTDGGTGGLDVTANTAALTPYLAYRLGRSLTLDVSGSYAYTAADIERAGGIDGDYVTHTLGLAAGIAYEHRLGPATTGSLRLGQSYAYSDSGTYTQSDGTLVPGSSDNSGQLSLTGRAEHLAGPVTLYGELAGGYDTFAADAAGSRWELRVKPGLRGQLDFGTLSVEAMATFRTGYRSAGGALQLDIPF